MLDKLPQELNEEFNESLRGRKYILTEEVKAALIDSYKSYNFPKDEERFEKEVIKLYEERLQIHVQSFAPTRQEKNFLSNAERNQESLKSIENRIQEIKSINNEEDQKELISLENNKLAHQKQIDKNEQIKKLPKEEYEAYFIKEAERKREDKKYLEEQFEVVILFAKNYKKEQNYKIQLKQENEKNKDIYESQSTFRKALLKMTGKKPNFEQIAINIDNSSTLVEGKVPEKEINIDEPVANNEERIDLEIQIEQAKEAHKQASEAYYNQSKWKSFLYGIVGKETKSEIEVKQAYKKLHSFELAEEMGGLENGRAK